MSAVGGAVVGRSTEPLPTASPVDSSTTSCPHPVVVGDGAVPVGTVPVLPDPDPVLPDPAGCVGPVTGVPTAPPAEAPAPPVVPALPVPPACPCGTTAGCAHMAPFGQGTGPGTTPTGGHDAASVHTPVVPPAVP